MAKLGYNGKMKAPPGTTNKSGIYRITCVLNGKVYIGSAVNIGGRIRGHISDLTNNRHPNRLLQRAWNKYGNDSFKVEIVELCEKSALLDREQVNMDRSMCVQPRGFNIHPISRSSLGLKRSHEQIEKMRKASSGKTLSAETRAKISESMKKVCKGKKVPPEMIEKARLHNTGRPLTEEQKSKMSKTRKGKSRPEGMMAKLAEFNRGKKRSPETIEKIKATKLKNKIKNNEC